MLVRRLRPFPGVERWRQAAGNAAGKGTAGRRGTALPAIGTVGHEERHDAVLQDTGISFQIVENKEALSRKGKGQGIRLPACRERQDKTKDHPPAGGLSMFREADKA